MSDIAKWGLLVAGAVLVIGLIFSAMGNFGWDLAGALELFALFVELLVGLAGDAFKFGRAMVNLLFVPCGYESYMTGLLIYLFVRWFVQLSVKIAAWVYHYIFK